MLLADQETASSKQKLFAQRGFTGIEVLVVMVVVGVLGGGTALASNQAGPGDTLFGLDLAIESLQERLTTDPIRKLDLKIKQAKEREEELIELEDEIENDDSVDKEQDLENAVILSREALQNAQETVQGLSTTIPANENAQTSEILQRVSNLLVELQSLSDNHSVILTRLKTKVKEGETKTKIETSENGVTQKVKVEEKVNEETGETERRVKVYQMGANGEEVKILDIKEENGKVEVETEDSSDDEEDQDSDDSKDEQEDSTDDQDEQEDQDDDEDEDDEAEVSNTPKPSATSEPTETPKPSTTPEPTEADEEDNSGQGNSESETYEIRWKDGEFSPGTVTINVGDKVEFKNEEDESIQVASNPHPAHTDLPDLNSGTMAKGAEYKYAFTQAGTWVVHNHLNTAQTATIIVQ